MESQALTLRQGRIRWRVLVYFLLGLAAVDFGISRYRTVWHRYDPDDYSERIHHCRKQRPELLLIGGSPVCEGLDPALLTGVRWQGQPLDRIYNLALPGATTSEVWHAVEHGVSASPCLIIYGMTASDLNDNRDEPHGPASLMTVGDLSRWFRYRRTSREWGLRHFIEGQLGRAWKTFQYRHAIRMWAADQAEVLWPGVCPQAASEARQGLACYQELVGGHGFAPCCWKAGTRLDVLKKRGAVPPFSFLDHYRVGEHLRYLQHLLHWADRAGVPVLLLDMPVSEDLELRICPQAFACYHEEVVQRLRENPRVWLIEATRERVGLADEDFTDLIHLNRQGATRLTSWLRAQLENASPRCEKAVTSFASTADGMSPADLRK